MNQAARLSLPNLLSLSRLLLAAVFILAPGVSARAALIVAAAASDVLDGWIARRRHAASAYGALLDPVTDRVFALVAMSVLLFEGALSTGQFLILLARDIATALGFLVARMVSWLRPVQFKARVPGKIVTGLQFVTLLAALLAPRLVNALVVAVAIGAAWAIVDYTFALWRARAR